jgi:hypothetical protein
VRRSEQTNDVESLLLLTGALAQYPTREIMPPTAVLELDISVVHNSDDGASKMTSQSSGSVNTSPPTTPTPRSGVPVAPDLLKTNGPEAHTVDVYQAATDDGMIYLSLQYDCLDLCIR